MGRSIACSTAPTSSPRRSDDQALPPRRVPDPSDGVADPALGDHRPQLLRPLLLQRPRPHGRRVPRDRSRSLPRARRRRRVRLRPARRPAALRAVLRRARGAHPRRPRRRVLRRGDRAVGADPGPLRRRWTRTRVRPHLAGFVPGGDGGTPEHPRGVAHDPRHLTIRPTGHLDGFAAGRRPNLRGDPGPLARFTRSLVGNATGRRDRAARARRRRTDPGRLLVAVRPDPLRRLRGRPDGPGTTGRVPHLERRRAGLAGRPGRTARLATGRDRLPLGDAVSGTGPHPSHRRRRQPAAHGGRDVQLGGAAHRGRVRRRIRRGS